MENIFLHLLKMSLTAGLLVVVVLLLRVVFCKAPRWIHCLLWALVAVRLLCPITPESSLSLMPDTTAAFSAVTEQLSTPQEEPDTPVVDNAVTDTPVVNTPVTNTPVVDTPVVDTPVVDTPVVTPTPNTPPSASVGTSTTNVAVSAPTPEAGVDPWQVAVAVASYVWLAGVVLLAAYAVFTTLRLHRQVREAARLSGRVWCCDHIRSPFILGVFRPRIYLPSDLDGVARDSVIAHEQAHLHRRDHWWKPLGFLLLMVHWFNPLMWVAYILLCRDIEAACDERVVRDMTAPDRKTYSEVLLACSAPRRLVSACPLAFGETSVKSRVKSVLSYKKPTIWIIVAALLVSTVAGVCLLTDPKPEDGKSDTKVTTTPEEEDSSKPPDDPDIPPPSTTTPNTEAENADYRWATYSHPVTVGDEGDVAVGYYSIFDYGRETLMPLVEGLEWYGADMMADTAFAALGYFTIDGQKKYYVSPDKKQLYDGEQIADLTAEQSEQLDFYLRDGNPGEDAIAASVTGTVTEWSKEGGYIMLEVTEGDSKLGPRVMAYTTILMPGSAPAVGYPATIYYDGWCDGRGFGSAIYAIHREWQDADLLGGPDDDEPTDPGNPDDKWLNYTVIVRGEIGNPLSGVKINISSENVAETITTDSTGVAKARLPEGVPTGTIEVPQGYVAASKKFTFAAGSTTLTIVLEKEQPVTPPTSTDLSTASVSFVKFSRPISGPSAATYSATRYMYPVVPDSTTCDFLRQLAMRTDWVKKDTYFGDYDAYFTIGDDKNYYYIDRVNGTIHHNRWFLPLSDEEVSKLDTLIRSYGIQNNSKITATVTDWRYLTGRVQECVEGQNGYVTLKLDPWWANIYGEKMKVSTRFIPYRYFANGSMVCVVYDGEAEQSAETGPLTIYAGSIDTLTETGIVSTGIPQYDNLLKQIQDYFYKRTTVRPDCSSAVWNCEALSDIGIKLIDLDNNGQDELVIGATNSTFWVGYSDVYTIQNGQLVQLFRSTDNNLYSIHKGGYICQEWTENTLWFGEDYYHVEGGQLVFCEGLMFSVNYASSLGYVRTDAWFRVTLQDGKKVYEHITEDEANAIAEKYGKNDLSYTLYVIPFSL